MVEAWRSSCARHHARIAPHLVDAAGPASKPPCSQPAPGSQATGSHAGSVLLRRTRAAPPSSPAQPGTGSSRRSRAAILHLAHTRRTSPRCAITNVSVGGTLLFANCGWGGGGRTTIRWVVPVECGCHTRACRRTHLMPAPVYRVMTLLSALVVALPIGTNLDVLTLLWLVCSGGLLDSRGAVIPGLRALGLDVAAVQRTWAALGHGAWTSAQLLGWWMTIVRAEGRWQPHTYAGYHPVAVDVTAFWRPRLRDCPTGHYHATAGKALPAIPVGIIARVGSVDGQRFGVPLAVVTVRACRHSRSLPQRAPAAPGGRGGGTVRAGRCARLRSRLSRAPGAGRGSQRLRRAGAQALHRAPGAAAGLRRT